MEKSLVPLVADCVSDTVFGIGNIDAARKHDRAQYLIDGSVFTTAALAKTNHVEKKLLDRGLVSHVKAQAEGLATFVRDAEHVWSVNCFDDASMWVQLGEVTLQPNRRCFRRGNEKYHAAVARRGKIFTCQC